MTGVLVGGSLTAAVAVAAVSCAVGWARRSLVLVTVAGASMEPTLRTGDRVLVRRAGLRSVRAGELVVLGPAEPAAPATRAASAAPPTSSLAGGQPWIIKRAVALPGDPVPRGVAALADVPEPAVPAGRLVLLGDGRVSADSRTHGYFDADRLLGVVVRRLPGR